MYEGNLWFQEFKCCGYFCSDVILRYHKLINLCTINRSFYSMYSYDVFSIKSIFICNIIVKIK